MEKSLSINMKKQELLEKFKLIQQQIKSEHEGEQVKVKLFDVPQKLTIEKTEIEVLCVEVEIEKKDKDLEKNKEEKNISFEYWVKCKDKEGNITQIRIGRTNENGDFEYDTNSLSKMDENIRKALGIPDDEHLDNKEVDLPDLSEKTAKTEKELETEAEKEKNAEKEPEKELTVEQIAEQEGLDKEQIPNIGEIDLNRKITRSSFKGIVPGLEGYNKIFIVPDKNSLNTYKLMGVTQDGKLKDLPQFKEPEGKNPTTQIISLQKDGMQTKTEQVNSIFELNNNEGFTVKKDTDGKPTISYYRRTPGDVYISTQVPQAHSKDRDIADEDVRYMLDRTQTSNIELQQKTDNYDMIKQLEQQDIPDEIDPTSDGIQLEEINDIEVIKETIIRGIIKENPNTYTYEQAKKIADNIVDKGMDFTEAKEIVDSSKQNTDKEKEEEYVGYGQAIPH
ncbi:MAG: hypothetical protein Q4G09_05070 [Clostridia bacterium]|nr:hypothetical protein [Clostridia bacterium]